MINQEINHSCCSSGRFCDRVLELFNFRRFRKFPKFVWGTFRKRWYVWIVVLLLSLLYVFRITQCIPIASRNGVPSFYLVKSNSVYTGLGGVCTKRKCYYHFYVFGWLFESVPNAGKRKLIDKSQFRWQSRWAWGLIAVSALSFMFACFGLCITHTTRAEEAEAIRSNPPEKSDRRRSPCSLCSPLSRFRQFRAKFQALKDHRKDKDGEELAKRAGQSQEAPDGGSHTCNPVKFCLNPYFWLFVAFLSWVGFAVSSMPVIIKAMKSGTGRKSGKVQLWTWCQESLTLLCFLYLLIVEYGPWIRRWLADLFQLRKKLCGCCSSQLAGGSENSRAYGPPLNGNAFVSSAPARPEKSSVASCSPPVGSHYFGTSSKPLEHSEVPLITTPDTVKTNPVSPLTPGSYTHGSTAISIIGSAHGNNTSHGGVETSLQQEYPQIPKVAAGPPKGRPGFLLRSNSIKSASSWSDNTTSTFSSRGGGSGGGVSVPVGSDVRRWGGEPPPVQAVNSGKVRILDSGNIPQGQTADYYSGLPAKLVEDLGRKFQGKVETVTGLPPEKQNAWAAGKGKDALKRVKGGRHPNTDGGVNKPTWAKPPRLG